MKNDIIHSKSISDLIKLSGFNKLKHPLIAIFDTTQMTFSTEMLGLKFRSDLYCGQSQ
ncbi:MAG: hypothetical protein ACI97N_002016 [Cognaticolwellia sp.]|jgi:hypothetical protein